jgi:hypothetical protein
MADAFQARHASLHDTFVHVCVIVWQTHDELASGRQVGGHRAVPGDHERLVLPPALLDHHLAPGARALAWRWPVSSSFHANIDGWMDGWMDGCRI